MFPCCPRPPFFILAKLHGYFAYATKIISPILRRLFRLYYEGYFAYTTKVISPRLPIILYHNARAFTFFLFLEPKPYFDLLDMYMYLLLDLPTCNK
jgi:hypothetical protein